MEIAGDIDRLVGVMLKQIHDDWKSGRCKNLPNEEKVLLFDLLSNRQLNKREASELCHISQSHFDYEVSIGRIPQGTKIQAGDTRLYWSIRDIVAYKNKYHKEA